MKIVELHAENVKRIRAVTIRPEGSMVVIGGRNAQGKSSTLDAIAYALGGQRLICDEPVRSGQKKAEVRVDLGDLVVTRRWRKGGQSELEVRDAEGVAQRSPQRLLDELMGRLTFDPLEFTRQPPKQQLETLRGIVGLDFAELDAQRAALFENRTDLGRQLRQKEAEWKATPYHEGAPEAEVSVSDLSRQLEQALQAAGARARDAEALEEMRKQIVREREAAARKIQALEELERRHQAELEELRQRHEREHAEAIDLQLDAERAVEDLSARIGTRALALSEAGDLVDPEPLRARIAAAEDENRRVRENARSDELGVEVLEVREAVAVLTARIEAIDSEKEAALAGAAFPVPGLAFDADGVLFNGIPLAQASSAEQLRISAAIGFALNPKLPVLLVREGSLLDDDGRALLAEMAESAGGQVWLEAVGKTGSVVIEDGSIAEG